LLGNWLIDYSTNFLGEWWSRQAAFLRFTANKLALISYIHGTCILFFNSFEPMLILSHTGV